jgi:hypothetical protein
MRRQGYERSTTIEAGGTFFVTGMRHSLTSAGTAWERTPWRATQRAAWTALSAASSMKKLR